MVGPEAVRWEGRPLHQVLRDRLFQSNAEDIAHYYDRDEIFLFRDKIAKEDIQREVILFYRDHNLDKGVSENLLMDLVRLKAHTVLSMNPDGFLSDLAFKYGVPHRFAYFQHGGAAVVDVETPSADMPLFYNLCGALERDSSLVLDYDDLFSLLSSLFGSPGLPPRLILELRQAKHFLFVGFNFDKWYSQLLLRLLSGEKAIRKFVIDRSNKSENTTMFLVKQFGIEFIDDEAAFLNELFRQAEEEGLLREIIRADTPEVVRIRHLLRIGDLAGALQIVNANTAWADTGSVISARFADLLDREARRILDGRERALEYNRIVDAVLETIKIPAA
ncbi:MAG: SIR2 family protein [Saprospiraceae bacterium]|nr:SIR2 family protein [Saprospiraceae bacterium]